MTDTQIHGHFSGAVANSTELGMCCIIHSFNLLGPWEGWSIFTICQSRRGYPLPHFPNQSRAGIHCSKAFPNPVPVNANSLNCLVDIWSGKFKEIIGQINVFPVRTWRPPFCFSRETRKNSKMAPTSYKKRKENTFIAWILAISVTFSPYFSMNLTKTVPAHVLLEINVIFPGLFTYFSLNLPRTTGPAGWWNLADSGKIRRWWPRDRCFSHWLYHCV